MCAFATGRVGRVFFPYSGYNLWLSISSYYNAHRSPPILPIVTLCTEYVLTLGVSFQSWAEFTPLVAILVSVVSFEIHLEA